MSDGTISNAYHDLWDRVQERIECAACRVLERKGVWKHYRAPRPLRHGDVLRLMPAEEARHCTDKDQGFFTSYGRYVSRAEAWDIAEAAGQLLPRAPTDGRGGRLYSEDVW